eukprot:scaffold48_cov311-Pinguiococcus_pyrenoidosus.AAC.300
MLGGAVQRLLAAAKRLGVCRQAGGGDVAPIPHCCRCPRPTRPYSARHWPQAQASSLASKQAEADSSGRMAAPRRAPGSPSPWRSRGSTGVASSCPGGSGLPSRCRTAALFGDATSASRERRGESCTTSGPLRFRTWATSASAWACTLTPSSWSAPRCSSSAL